MAEQTKSSTGLDENIAGALAYIPIVGLVFLVIEKESTFVRFHSVQSLLLAAAIFVLFIILTIGSFIPFLGIIIGIFNLILSCFVWVVFIIGMIQAYQGKRFKFPVIGKIAEEQAQKLPS
jgi:uncharacterized membrane protein